MEGFYPRPEGKEEIFVQRQTVTSSCGNVLVMVTILIGLPFLISLTSEVVIKVVYFSLCIPSATMYWNP